MILVDVIFPELNRTIDFQLDENAKGWEIVEEIAVMAGRSCSRGFDAKNSVVLLYSMNAKRSLDLNSTLRGNNVQSGDQLVFL